MINSIQKYRVWMTLAALALMVGGCANKPERIVLLPQEGRTTSLIVTGPTGSTVTLSEPYAEAVVTHRETTAGKTDAETVNKRYGSTLSATPFAPKRFVVYFLSGGNELTPESLAQLPGILAEISKVPAAEVVITGHTDRVGPVEINDTLSLQRAQTVRTQLIAAGAAADKITTAGRGEREPLVPTADEVSEPRNRRVEIKVR